MKSAYYIAQSNNLERFNGLFDREGILATSFSANKIPSLTAFVMRDKAIAQQDYVLIDVGTVKMWSMSHILSAVQHLRRFSSAQLIFIGGPCEDVTELFGTLASIHHVDGLITDRAGADLEEELGKCFAGRARLPDKMQAITEMMVQQAAQAVKPLTVPPGLVVYVALAGTMARCGTTTQAFAIYHYLKSLGFHPAIWDKIGQLLPLLMKYEQLDRGEDGAITIRGVNFCTHEMPRFDAYIVDYGVLTPENAPLFCKTDLSVLVGCTKPWELPAFAQAIKLLFGYSCQHLVVLASFSTPEELAKVTKYLGERSGIAPYNPDWWELPAGATTYTDLILPALKEICGAPAQRTPDLEVS